LRPKIEVKADAFMIADPVNGRGPVGVERIVKLPELEREAGETLEDVTIGDVGTRPEETAGVAVNVLDELGVSWPDDVKAELEVEITPNAVVIVVSDCSTTTVYSEGRGTTVVNTEFEADISTVYEAACTTEVGGITTVTDGLATTAVNVDEISGTSTV